MALKEALSGGGVWIGNSGEPAPEATLELTDHPGAPFDRLSFDVTEEEHEGYYLGYANSVLWPLCHRRVDLMRMRPDYLSAYRRVNRRIARMVARVVGPGDRIWVQDYHHLPLAHELRALGVSNPVGLFLHIPFPGPMAFQALPNADEVARWITAFDLFGLQGRRDVSACLESMRTECRAPRCAPTARSRWRGRRCAWRALSHRHRRGRLPGGSGARGGRGDGSLPAQIIGVDRPRLPPRASRSGSAPMPTSSTAALTSRGRWSFFRSRPPTREAVPGLPRHPRGAWSSCRGGSTASTPTSTGRPSDTSTARSRATGWRCCSATRAWGW